MIVCDTFLILILGRRDLGEEAEREEEEREALAIQQRMAETLDDGDFGLDLFKVSQ